MLRGRSFRHPAIAASVAASTLAAAFAATALSASSITTTLSTASVSTTSFASAVAPAAFTAASVTASVASSSLTASALTAAFATPIASSVSASDPVPAGFGLPLLSARLDLRCNARSVRILGCRDGRLPARGHVESGRGALQAVWRATVHAGGARGESSERVWSRRRDGVGVGAVRPLGS